MDINELSKDNIMKNPRALLIDDCRDLASATVVARNSQEGIAILEKLGHFEILMLDHDLGYASHGSGYDVACWLEANPQYLPDSIELVTSNPVGRKNMAAVFKKFYANVAHDTFFSKRITSSCVQDTIAPEQFEQPQPPLPEET